MAIPSNQLPEAAPYFPPLSDDVPEPPAGVIVPGPGGAAWQDAPEVPWGPGPSENSPPVGEDDWERGFRQAVPTSRPVVWDDGQSLEHEQKKKQYPPMREILATGRYFGMAEWQLQKPYFLGNPAITVTSPGLQQALQYDFDTESAPRFRAGFESKYGPGVELQYSQFDHLSDTLSFTSDGLLQGVSRVGLAGQGQSTSLATAAAGERIDARHDLELHQLGVGFFKEVKLPISRVNGIFGARYVSVAQRSESLLSDGSGAVIGRLASQTDLRALGPNLGLEYYRPVGHTPFELIGAFNGSVLFGNRDHFVQNEGVLDFREIGSNEMLAIVDFFGGLQYVKHTGEKRSWYARLGVNNQIWLGGGTAVEPTGDFGLRGISFAFGLNR